MGGTVVQGLGGAGDLQVAPTTVESERIAGLVGPTLMVLSASEALNYHIWNDNLPPVIYLDGALLFMVASRSSGSITAGCGAGRC